MSKAVNEKKREKATIDRSGKRKGMRERDY